MPSSLDKQGILDSPPQLQHRADREKIMLELQRDKDIRDSLEATSTNRLYYVSGAYKAINQRESDLIEVSKKESKITLVGHVDASEYRVRKKDKSFYIKAADAATEILACISFMDSSTQEWIKSIEGQLKDLSSKNLGDPTIFQEVIDSLDGEGKKNEIHGVAGLYNLVLAWQRIKNIYPDLNKAKDDKFKVNDLPKLSPGSISLKFGSIQESQADRYAEIKVIESSNTGLNNQGNAGSEGLVPNNVDQKATGPEESKGTDQGSKSTAGNTQLPDPAKDTLNVPPLPSGLSPEPPKPAGFSTARDKASAQALEPAKPSKLAGETVPVSGFSVEQSLPTSDLTSPPPASDSSEEKAKTSGDTFEPKKAEGSVQEANPTSSSAKEPNPPTDKVPVPDQSSAQSPEAAKPSKVVDEPAPISGRLVEASLPKSDVISPPPASDSLEEKAKTSGDTFEPKKAAGSVQEENPPSASTEESNKPTDKVPVPDEANGKATESSPVSGLSGEPSLPKSDVISLPPSSDSSEEPDQSSAQSSEAAKPSKVVDEPILSIDSSEIPNQSIGQATELQESFDTLEIAQKPSSTLDEAPQPTQSIEPPTQPEINSEFDLQNFIRNQAQNDYKQLQQVVNNPLMTPDILRYLANTPFDPNTNQSFDSYLDLQAAITAASNQYSEAKQDIQSNAIRALSRIAIGDATGGKLGEILQKDLIINLDFLDNFIRTAENLSQDQINNLADNILSQSVTVTDNHKPHLIKIRDEFLTKFKGNLSSTQLQSLENIK